MTGRLLTNPGKGVWGMPYGPSEGVGNPPDPSIHRRLTQSSTQKMYSGTKKNASFFLVTVDRSS